MAITFGSEIVFTLTALCGRILIWKEGKARTIPVKKIYSKSSPTTQAQFHTEEAKTYLIVYRASNAEKSTMQSIMAECLPHQLFYGATYIDDVWLDDVAYKYDDTIINKPWIISLTLIRVGEFLGGHLRGVGVGESGGHVASDKRLYYPNLDKPYYYNGWYYVFCREMTINYRIWCYKSNDDGATWTLENNNIASATSVFSSYGMDDKIMILYTAGSAGQHSKTGSIQADGSITWGPAVPVYPVNPAGWTTNFLYGSKIGDTRRWFAFAQANSDQIRIEWSEDDGASWSGGNYCDSIISGGAFVIPYTDPSNPLRMETIFHEWSRKYKARERDGASCGGLDTLTTAFIHSEFPYGSICPIKVGDYIHVVYLNTSGVIKHKRATYAGSWEELPDIKTGLANTQITLCYDEGSDILFILYTIWNTATTSWDVRFKEWCPSTATLSPDGYDYWFYANENETSITRLTAYPYPVNEGVIIVWMRGSTVRFFRKQMLVK